MFSLKYSKLFFLLTENIKTSVFDIFIQNETKFANNFLKKTSHLLEILFKITKHI